MIVAVALVWLLLTAGLLVAFGLVVALQAVAQALHRRPAARRRGHLSPVTPSRPHAGGRTA